MHNIKQGLLISGGENQSSNTFSPPYVGPKPHCVCVYIKTSIHVSTAFRKMNKKGNRRENAHS